MSAFTEDMQPHCNGPIDSRVTRHYRSKVEALEADLAEVRRERDAWQAAYDGLIATMKGGEICV